jgi:HPt (histidine-containing phosphotransfer) domain-containing protein
MSEEKLLDLDELDSITGGDEEIKQGILTSFLDTIYNDVETLQRYIKRELRMEAEVHAHTMKGVARSISAKKVKFGLTIFFLIKPFSTSSKK